MASVHVLAPAKLNLALDIVGRFPNGYHDLDMIMQTIDLYDEITIEQSETLQVICPGMDIAPEKNIAYKAAVKFLHSFSGFSPVKITIVKNIPSQAGMAGGSSDAAAVLSGLNVLYNRPYSTSQLMRLGAEIGADVPFCLMGGTCRVKGIGDVIQPLPALKSGVFVVIMPEFGISTPEAFAAFDCLPIQPHSDVESQAEAIVNNDYLAVCKYASNSLQQVSQKEVIEIICRQLLLCGSDAALMTGSGAAVFGMFSKNQTAENAVKKLSCHYKWVKMAHPITGGTLDLVKKLTD